LRPSLLIVWLLYGRFDRAALFLFHVLLCLSICSSRALYMVGFRPVPRSTISSSPRSAIFQSATLIPCRSAAGAFLMAARAVSTFSTVNCFSSIAKMTERTASESWPYSCGAGLVPFGRSPRKSSMAFRSVLDFDERLSWLIVEICRLSRIVFSLRQISSSRASITLTISSRINKARVKKF